MARTITNFLVGIGYDTTELQRGERDITTSMEGIKSLATVTGAALGAAFIGIGKISINTANKVNELRLQTNTLYSSTGYVNDYGNALKLLGGNASDAVGELSRVETALSNLRNKGDASTFTELAYYGVDTQNLTQAESGGDFMQRLATQFPQLNRQQQAGVAQTLGLSPATVELLRKGSDGYRDIMNHAHDVAGLSNDLIKSAQEYNSALAETQLKWDGIKNTIAEAVLPSITQVVTKSNEFVERVVTPLAKSNPDLVQNVTGGVATATGGAVLSTAGAAAGAIGIPGAGLLRAGGNAGLLIGAGQIADSAIAQPLQKRYPWLTDNPVVHGIEYAQDALSSDKPLFDVPKWARETFMGSDASNAAAEATGKAVAQAVRDNPIKVQSTVQNNLTVELDGRALDSKITEVQQRNNQMTVDDMQSTTAR